MDANETAASRCASDIAFGGGGGGTTDDRRPSDPLHRRPNLSPIRTGVWPTYYYYRYYNYYVVIARRVGDSPPPATAPTPSPEEVPRP